MQELDLHRQDLSDHPTLDEPLTELDTADLAATAEAIDRITDRYNHERLHSALSFLRPVAWNRGKPEALLAERRRKLIQAREPRKQENLQLRPRPIPWPKAPECLLFQSAGSLIDE